MANPSPPENQKVTIPAIKLEPIENAAVFYANHIEVANTPQDFSLICARLPGKLSAAKIAEIKELGALVIEPEVQIVIPARLVPGLIRALTAQKELYEKTFGEPLEEVGARKAVSGVQK